MNHDYPHLSDTKFPDLPTVDVYKYRNEYDYDRYKETVRIKMMNVSWCGDYDNTVYFDTKQKRDQWFEAQKGLVKELPTMFRLYNDGTVKVDLPIDECMDYNYVMIDYGKLPNQAEKSDQSKMFYFINNVTQESPNATTLYLTVDYWTTFINDMDISYVNLARGHAPMAETNAEAYLSNPIENSEYLLTADVSYGELQRQASNDNIILNDSDILLGFLSNGQLSPSADWNGRIDTSVFYSGESQGLSAVDIYLIETDDFDEFRDMMQENCPQFFTTVKGMFLIPRKLVRINSTFDFYGITVHTCDTTGDKHIADYVINKAKFAYPSNIADIAKLYTFPYAAIEVNDFKGNATIIKVEDTIGKLELHTIMCDMYPFLNVEAYMLGLGGNVRTSISFVNNMENTFNIGGRYYNFSTKWSIPVFAVQLTVEQNWALNNKIGADASKQNAYASADTAQTNIYASADTAYSNIGIGNAAVLDNNELLIDTNDAITAKGISIASTTTDYNNAFNQAMQAWNAGYSRAMQVTDAEAADKSAMATVGTGALSTIGNMALTAANATNPTQAMVGMVGQALNGVASAVNTTAQTAISIDASATKTELGITNTQASVDESRTNNLNLVARQNEMSDFVNDAQNTLSAAQTGNNVDANIGIGANNRDVAKANADRLNATSKANADRSWNAAHDQTLLKNPPMYGQLTGTPDIISKPFGLSYNVVTQSKNAIRQAAEQFLRYGYALNMEWNIDTFNKMPKFTYWECDKVYCNDNGVFEGAQDMIKSILNQGTTVWRNPDEIGLVSIYTNI